MREISWRTSGKMAALQAFADAIESIMVEVREELEEIVSVEARAVERLKERFHSHEEWVSEEEDFAKSSLEVAKSNYEKLYEFLDRNDGPVDPETFHAILKPLISASYSNGLITLHLRKDLDSTNEDIQSLVDLFEALDKLEHRKDRLDPSSERYDRDAARIKRDIGNKKTEIRKTEGRIGSSLKRGVYSDEKEKSTALIKALYQKIEAHFVLGEVHYLTGTRTEVNPDPAKRLDHTAEVEYMKVVEEGEALTDILDTVDYDLKHPLEGDREKQILTVSATYLEGMAHHRLATLYETQGLTTEDAHKALERHRNLAGGLLRMVITNSRSYEIEVEEALTPLERKELAKATEHYR